MHVEAQRVEYWEFEIARLEDEIRIAEEKNDETSLIKYMAALSSAKNHLRDAKQTLEN